MGVEEHYKIMMIFMNAKFVKLTFGVVRNYKNMCEKFMCEKSTLKLAIKLQPIFEFKITCSMPG